MKMHMYVSSPQSFLDGDRQGCFSFAAVKTNITGWIYIQEVEFNVDLDVSLDELLGAINAQELALSRVAAAQNDS